MLTFVIVFIIFFFENSGLILCKLLIINFEEKTNTID